MEILFTTSEIAPYSQRSEVSEICQALPKALRGLDHSVTVLSPLYENIDITEYSLARRLSTMDIQIGGRKYCCEIYDGRTPAGVDLMFLSNKELFQNDIYDTDSEIEFRAIQIFAFSRFTINILLDQEPAFQILHIQDWLGAAAAVLTKKELPDLPVVLSLNTENQPECFSSELQTKLGIDPDLFETFKVENHYNLLKGAISSADHLITDSLNNLDETLKKPENCALYPIVQQNKDKLFKVVKGIDAAIWNPMTDVHLKYRFDPNNLAGKQRCKASLQFDLSLPVKAERPLLTVLNDLTNEQGWDLILKVIGQILNHDLQLIVGGNAQKATPSEVQDLLIRYPDRLRYLSSPDESLTHQIIAASDLLLIPYREQRYNKLQLCAHRYGSLPIVLKSASCIETIVDCDSGLKTGNGFIIEEADPDELVASIQRAIAAFHINEPFQNLQKRVMRIDNSWDRAARHYDYIYKKACILT